MGILTALSNAVLCIKKNIFKLTLGELVKNISTNPKPNCNHDNFQIFKTLIKIRNSLMCLVPMQRSSYLHEPPKKKIERDTTEKINGPETDVKNRLQYLPLPT